MDTQVTVLPSDDVNTFRIQIQTGERTDVTRATVPRDHAAYRKPGDTRCNKEAMQSLVDEIIGGEGPMGDFRDTPPPVATYEFLIYDLRVFLHTRRRNIAGARAAIEMLGSLAHSDPEMAKEVHTDYRCSEFTEIVLHEMFPKVWTDSDVRYNSPKT
mmetsp:Transcript_51001/g.116221  ORF Transcript_51001/g.116221 Transcript_51001/m.116221 type:complete len:157 (+) Transcript_51001:202-672(+)